MRTTVIPVENNDTLAAVRGFLKRADGDSRWRYHPGAGGRS
jgi:hypothetical protein